MPVIQLTEDARTVLLNYRWPGNVRQLKNITEQISIFETNRDVDGATLQNYLPQYNIEKLPARATSNEQEHSFFEKERKMLYKTLFEMQKEPGRPTCESRRTDEEKIQGQTSYAPPTGSCRTIDGSYSYRTICSGTCPVRQTNGHRRHRRRDNTQRTRIYRGTTYNTRRYGKRDHQKGITTESRKTEKTAEELKISERTLYRKIKEYNLE